MSDPLIPVCYFDDLLCRVRQCDLCAGRLPLGPKPVVQLSASAKLMIIGQAPGRRVHESGIPWNDPSGDRLRDWLQLSPEAFYDTSNIAIMPMGFCYPGTGKSGDLPPRKECAETWHQPLMQHLPNIHLTLLIGQYAQRYYLGQPAMSLIPTSATMARVFACLYAFAPSVPAQSNMVKEKSLVYTGGVA